MSQAIDTPDSEATPAATHSRKGTRLKIVAALAVAAALIAASILLPVRQWLEDFNLWVGQLGLLGPVVFAAVYVLTTVLLLPGAILTVGAGFVFGLGWGFAAVSVGSTVGAALAFLIGRFLAREKIEGMTKSRPRFRSVDRAIGQRGAKLIMLLRLSPVIPFNLSNYFYGLTAVKFWPYVLASWIGMMPGTLLYVYFGTLGKASVEAATGADSGRSPLEWTLLVVGLLATLAVTVWVSLIARKALQETEEVKEEA